MEGRGRRHANEFGPGKLERTIRGDRKMDVGQANKENIGQVTLLTQFGSFPKVGPPLRAPEKSLGF
jgi:hypothetical protein